MACGSQRHLFNKPQALPRMTVVLPEARGANDISAIITYPGISPYFVVERGASRVHSEQVCTASRHLIGYGSQSTLACTYSFSPWLSQIELTYGSRVLGPSSVGAPEYIGNGAYQVSYVATKVCAAINSVKLSIMLMAIRMLL